MSGIFIVEDEHILGYFLRTNLENNHYKVQHIVAAENLAIEYVTQHSPDLILLDVQLKHTGSGIRVAQHVKKIRPHTPVIFMTAYSDSAIITTITEMGYDYILKPFEFEQLKKKIDATMLTSVG